MILAIDTSTSRASVGLMDGAIPRAEQCWTAAGNHSETLHRVLREMLALEGLTVADLTAVVVAIGPGSFNGIRVALSSARGLAVARSLPLVGVPTLDVIALQAALSGEAVLALMDAGRGQIYAARYSGSYGDQQCDGGYRLLSLEEAAAAARPDDVLAGPARLVVARNLHGMGRHVRVAPDVYDLRRAGYLAELGRRRIEMGLTDGMDVEPLYLRPSAAEEKRLREDGP